MNPEAVQLIVDVIREFNQRTLYERELKGYNEGFMEGKEKGLSESRTLAMEEIAVKLKDVLSVEEISECTGLTVERVKELI